MGPQGEARDVVAQGAGEATMSSVITDGCLTVITGLEPGGEVPPFGFLPADGLPA